MRVSVLRGVVDEAPLRRGSGVADTSESPVGTHVVQLRHWLCSMRPGCEPSEFTVETLRFLQEGRVADAIVPGGLLCLALLQNVVAHRRQHDDVRAAVGDEHRNREAIEYCREIKLAL